MDTTALRNKLITYMTYGNLKKDIIREIQEGLLKNTKEAEFEELLKKVENEMKTKRVSTTVSE